MCMTCSRHEVVVERQLAFGRDAAATAPRLGNAAHVQSLGATLLYCNEIYANFIAYLMSDQEVCGLTVRPVIWDVRISTFNGKNSTTSAIKSGAYSTKVDLSLMERRTSIYIRASYTSALRSTPSYAPTDQRPASPQHRHPHTPSPVLNRPG